MATPKTTAPGGTTGPLAAELPMPREPEPLMDGPGNGPDPPPDNVQPLPEPAMTLQPPKGTVPALPIVARGGPRASVARLFDDPATPVQGPPAAPAPDPDEFELPDAAPVSFNARTTPPPTSAPNDRSQTTLPPRLAKLAWDCLHVLIRDFHADGTPGPASAELERMVVDQPAVALPRARAQRDLDFRCRELWPILLSLPDDERAAVLTEVRRIVAWLRLTVDVLDLTAQPTPSMRRSRPSGGSDPTRR